MISRIRIGFVRVELDVRTWLQLMCCAFTTNRLSLTSYVRMRGEMREMMRRDERAGVQAQVEQGIRSITLIFELGYKTYSSVLI